jgi:hypothetical protein
MSMVVEAKIFPRVVLLNALPLNAIPKDMYYFDIACKRTTPEAIVDIVRHSAKIENFIRHESTVKLLSRLLNVELKPSAGLYTYESGDILVVVTLKRPQRGQEVTELSEEDLEYFICTVTAIPQSAYGTTD